MTLPWHIIARASIPAEPAQFFRNQNFGITPVRKTKCARSEHCLTLGVFLLSLVAFLNSSPDTLTLKRRKSLAGSMLKNVRTAKKLLVRLF
jgi:hypothetical protein